MRALALLPLLALSVCCHDPPREVGVVQFSNELYSQLGCKSPEAIAKHFRADYAALDTDGTLGATLAALYGMRVLDLQRSIAHAEKMQMVLALLAQH